MRYSLIAWIGGVLTGIVACGDGDPLGIGAGGSAGAPVDSSGGSAGSARGGSGGTAGSSAGGSSGSSGKGSGGNGGTGNGGTGNGGTGSGGTGNGGTGASGGASAGGSGGQPTAGSSGTQGGNQAAGSSGGGSSGTGGTEAGAGGADDDGGQGGAADGGEGGAPEPGCPGGQVSCGEQCVDPAERVLDQRQLDMPGSSGLSVRQRPGQSFTVGATGLLKGIEVAVGPCNDADTTGLIRMELFDSSEQSLGQVTIEQASLPVVCGGEQLVEGAMGAGYFDLTPLCLAVEAGDVLTFMLSVAGNPLATCDQATFQCSNGGRSCDFDQDCEGFFYVGETLDAYAGGSTVMQDPTTGTLTASPLFDLAFKTFVK